MLKIVAFLEFVGSLCVWQFFCWCWESFVSMFFVSSSEDQSAFWCFKSQ